MSIYQQDKGENILFQAAKTEDWSSVREGGREGERGGVHQPKDKGAHILLQA